VIVTIAGDIDGDYFVGGFDLLFGLAPAFGSAPGDPNWNPNADLDGDGFVGGFDLLFHFAPNFGSSC
jgi:hypothetical protein